MAMTAFAEWPHPGLIVDFSPPNAGLDYATWLTRLVGGQLVRPSVFVSAACRAPISLLALQATIASVNLPL